MKRILLILSLLSAFSFQLSAQEENRTLFGIGYSSIYDTYLSPLHYRGLELRVLHEREHWGVSGYISYTRNPVRNAKDLSANLTVDYSLHKHWQLFPHLDVAAGGKAEVFVGGTYSTRNGNNPGQLRTGLDVAPSIKARYDFHLWKKNFVVSYRGSLPLLGVQFSPQYGQSYYEIFSRGGYDHNVQFYAPWKGLCYTHQVTLDIPLGKHSLTIGYLGDYRQSKFNSIGYHNFSHLGLIGWNF